MISILLCKFATKYLLGLCNDIPQTNSPHSFHPKLDSQREDCKQRTLKSEWTTCREEKHSNKLKNCAIKQIRERERERKREQERAREIKIKRETERQQERAR